MNTSDNCKHCGGWRGLHHFETNQCPVGGTEAPIGREQRWNVTTFAPDDTWSINMLLDALRNIVDDFEDGQVTQASINKAKRALGRPLK